MKDGLPTIHGSIRTSGSARQGPPGWRLHQYSLLLTFSESGSGSNLARSSSAGQSLCPIS